MSDEPRVPARLAVSDDRTAGTSVPFTPKVLVVDDRVQNILVLRTILAELDVEILEARSGTEALELLLVEEVAVALVDVQMPEMDGFELADLIRGSARTADIPIIFVTAAEFTRERISRGYDAGAVDFLFKPLDAHVLKHKVEYFISAERRKQQLAALLRLREEFVAIVSHDLRNPLNSIALTGNLLSSSADPVAQLASQHIQRGVERMGDIIRDLLDLSRARLGGGIPIAVSACDIGSIVHDVVAEFRADPSLSIEVSLTGDASGTWDSTRISQVVSNLLGNAVDHGEPGPIHIDINGADARTVTLSVFNAGFIEESRQRDLFQPFNPPNNPNPVRKGLGLGLYIIREVVRAHGGVVSVQSSKEHGTTFSIRLPRAHNNTGVEED